MLRVNLAIEQKATRHTYVGSFNELNIYKECTDLLLLLFCSPTIRECKNSFQIFFIEEVRFFPIKDFACA